MILAAREVYDDLQLVLATRTSWTRAEIAALTPRRQLELLQRLNMKRD